MPTVLISGSSIAGATLAYWLDRHGFKTTIVERAPEPRLGGQAVDIRGAALDVVARMGVLDEIRAAKTGMRGMTVVDRDGNELMSTTEETLTGGAIDSPDVEIMRDDLVTILNGLTGNTKYLFNDTITALEQDPDGVLVTFENAPPRRYDLVIGADGLHSRVRKLAFGDEAQFRSHLGVYLAIFTMDNHLGLENWQTMLHGDNLMAMVYNACGGKVTRGMLGFESDVLDFDYRDLDAQKRIVESRVGDAGWETPQIVKAMWAADDFYFDAMSQIKMDRWSKGRVGLVGDAGYCPAPLSGQGTSVAIVGAYVLAGELAKADPATAFAAYEAELREYVTQNQALATANPGGPPSPESMAAAASGITLKDYGTRR
ncbi:FAD-dependent monooxygenase [Actinokineospora sp. HUAS TT18]|uniref:FAD-dependent monooxygenase n=1 Tax=Actinokineospora sp. HUAS TT18 TaxID=3447451 RepID=UPI003F524559